MISSLIPSFDKANCEGEEIILLLIHHLPPDLIGYWLRCEDMQSILERGGIKFSHKHITDRIRTQKLITLKPNKFRNKRWFPLHEEEMKYPTPKQQLAAEKELPQIDPNYFTDLGIKFKYIGVKSKSQTTTGAASNNNNIASASTTASPTTSTNNSNNNSSSSNINSSNNTTTNNNSSTAKKKSTSSTPSIDPSATGLMFANLSIVRDTVELIDEHRKKCNASLKVTHMNRSGFEVFHKLGCNFCKRSFEIRSGPKPADDDTTKKRGRKTSQLNMILTNGMHSSATQIGKMKNLCMEVGCISPSETGLHLMMLKRKKSAIDVTEDVLRENRKEHVKILKELDPENTITHTDAEGNTHNICYGTVCADGAGDKRAYNHIITGSQHLTVVFSAVTNKVLAVKHDQVSCGKCSRKMTQLLVNENKRMEDITEDDLKHEGECHINTKHGPAVAEEYALESIAEYLLIDPETKKLRSDDEAILVDWFVADGDTKGAIRFIKKQASIIMEFEGKAIYVPDIGHFIKCISNALFYLAKNNSTLRGVSLLEASRIKAITTDITTIIKAYGREMKCIREECNGNTSIMNEKLKVAREATMTRISAIIPHHCNDHSTCSRVDCYVKTRERHYLHLYRSANRQSSLTDEAIIQQHATQVAKDHADNGRFRGKHMSMGKQGQRLVHSVISTRLDEKNIDRVAESCSSNRCENMFNVTAKHSEGKRLYQGRSNTFKSNAYYVASTINNNKHDIENRIRERTGVTNSSTVREEAYKKDQKRKEYHQEVHRKEQTKKRRKKAKIASTSKAVKNSKATARHKSDKLSPKNECKSNVAKKKQAAKKPSAKKRKRKCTNCKLFHNGECEEPTYSNDSKKKVKKTKISGYTEDDWMEMMEAVLL